MSSSDILPLLQTILSRLDAIESKIGGDSSASTTTNSSNTGTELPRSIKAFDSYCLSFLEPFVAAADKLGGDAAAVGKLTKEAWLELRSFLLKASACKEPSQTELPKLLGDIGSKIKAISSAVQRNEWERHAKVVNEGVGALQWVMIKPAPRDFIESFVGGSDYWANNIRREFRTTNPDHIAFCDTFKTLLLELMVYVKEHHATGVTWNPKGVSVAEYNPDTSAVPVAQASVQEVAKPVAVAKAASSAPAPALFAELNKGGSITSGLKTVTKDMQTWRSEYKNDAPTPAKVVPKVAPRVAETVKGPAKLEFQEGGSKWIVENQSSSASITIKDKKETVYVYGCIGATIDITGKCKSIVVDTCKKTKVFFDAAMASIEVVNSQRMEIHTREKVPSVAIDKTDGIIVYLSESSMDTTIVASKSSEMNVSFPDENGDLIERPIPEQYVHRVVNKAVTAEVSDLYTH